MRRLLWASAEIRALVSEHPASWGDFEIEAMGGAPWCPDGRSIWSTDVRRGMPSEPETAGLTYILVAPTLSGELHGPRKDLRVLSADQLAAWLASCPAVTVWFWLELLRRPAMGALDLESYLARWSRRSRPPLPAELVLEGREREAGQVGEWVAGGPSVRRRSTSLAIYADSLEEARVFSAATIAALSEPARSLALARAVVVSSRDAWTELVITASRELILIPEFDVDASELEHLVLLPRAGEIPRLDQPRAPEDRVELREPLAWRAVAERLQDLGLSEGRALRVAEESRGYLGPLRRLLGGELPAWADEGPPRELAALLLLGAWVPTREADAEAVHALGEDPRALEALCTRLAMQADPPIERREEAWCWRSPADAWAGLAHLLYDSLISDFGELVLAVLGTQDPAWQLPVHERVMAPLQGLTPPHSDELRTGVAESLVRLTLMAEREGLSRRVIEQQVYKVLRTILAPGWRCWASLGELLPILAEAEPREFLTKLEESVRAEGGVVELFEQERVGWSSPHLPLMQALELLAWDPSVIARVAGVLARLAEQDPGRHDTSGRWTNRPHTSLQGIFHLVVPQTAADDEARFAALERLVDLSPEVGLELLMHLLDQLRGGIIPEQARPRFRSEAPPVPETFDLGQVHARARRVEALLMQAVGEDPQRWVKLLDAGVDRELNGEALDEAVTRLIERRPEDPSDVLWAAVRRRLHKHYFFTREEESDATERLNRLNRLYAAFEPKDQVRRYTWRFEPQLIHPEPQPRPFDFGKLEVQIDERRLEALEDILARDEAEDVLTAMVAKLGDDLRDLGRTLARSSQVEAFEELLLARADPPPGLAPLAPALAAGVFVRREQDWDWLEQLLRSWLEQGRKSHALALTWRLWAQPPLWDLLDRIGVPLRDEYWAGCRRIGQHPGQQWQRALDNLLATGNLRVALEAAEAAESLGYAEFSLSSLVRLLEAAGTMHVDLAGNALPHAIRTVFGALHHRVEADLTAAPELETLARLELPFLALLDVGKRQAGPRYLPRVLERPHEYIELVKLIYRAQSAPKDSVEPAQQDRAAAAARVLHAWRGFPGDGIEDSEERERILYGWATQVLAGLAAADRAKVAQHVVGEILARPLRAADGHWPCAAARTLLESGDHPRLEDGIRLGKRNLIGLQGWIKQLYEGGRQERERAETFAHSAEVLRVDWPRTAALLDSLARSFEREAEREDELARVERIQAGVPAVSVPESPESSDSEPSDAEQDKGPPLLHRLERLEIHALGPAPRFDLEFSPRLNLIAGDNGLGKTFLLDIAWWSLAGSWPDEPAWPTLEARERQPRIGLAGSKGVLVSSIFDRRREDWPRVPEWPRPAAPIVYARIDGGVSVWDPLRNDLYGLYDRRSLPALHFDAGELERGLLDERDGTTSVCNGYIEDWEHWRHNEPELFERFFTVVRGLFAPTGAGRDVPKPGPARPLWTKTGDATPIPTIELSYGRVPLVHLSAGMRRILGLAYALVWTWHSHVSAAEAEGRPPAAGMIMLLDEVEAHLHPKWQRLVVPALLRAIEELTGGRVQLLATSHSPMVLASLEPLFEEPRDRLFHLEQRDDGEVVLDVLPWARHGAVGDWLRSRVFGGAQPFSLEAERAIEAARLLIRKQTPEDPELRTLEQVGEALRLWVPREHEVRRRWRRIYGDDEGVVTE